MRREGAAAVAAGLVLIPLMFFAAPAGAGEGGGEGEALPEALEPEAIAALLATVTDEFGVDEFGFPILPDDLDVLIGEAGERDLPESDLVFATPEQQAAAAVLIEEAGGRIENTGSGSSLTGPCMGITWSYRADGTPLYAAMDFDQAAPPIQVYPNFGDPAFTSDDPFLVDVNGVDIYAGVAGGRNPGTGPRNHVWFIEIKIGPVGAEVDAGGDPNGQGENRNLGSVSLKEDLPAVAKVNAKVRINGQMMADNGFKCGGAGYLEFVGGRDLTGPGAALVLISGVGMLFNARPARTFQGVV